MNNSKNEMHGNAYTVRNALKRKAQNPKSDFILRSQSFILKSAKRENFRDRRFFSRFITRDLKSTRFQARQSFHEKEQTARIFAS